MSASPRKPLMSDPIRTLLDLVAPRLVPGETVWAVYAGGRALVATNRRLFFLSAGQLSTYDLAEFDHVERAREDLIVLDRPDGPPIAMTVAPDDEAGLQALTVVGLLVALRDRIEHERPAH